MKKFALTTSTLAFGLAALTAASLPTSAVAGDAAGWRYDAYLRQEAEKERSVQALNQPDRQSVRLGTTEFETEVARDRDSASSGWRYHHRVARGSEQQYRR